MLYVRTTVELPLELLRAAKARSAGCVESLKTLLTRAVAAELEVELGRTSSTHKVRLPVFGDAAGPPVRLTGADLERALAASDLAPTKTRRTARRQRRP